MLNSCWIYPPMILPPTSLFSTAKKLVLRLSVLFIFDFNHYVGDYSIVGKRVERLQYFQSSRNPQHSPSDWIARLSARGTVAIANAVFSQHLFISTTAVISSLFTRKHAAKWTSHTLYFQVLSLRLSSWWDFENKTDYFNVDAWSHSSGPLAGWSRNFLICS